MLGVEGVLEVGQRLRSVLDPEVDDAGSAFTVGGAAEVGHQRVVGVEDHHARPPWLLREPCPIVGQPIQLAVAVELVAEQVAEHEGVRSQLLHHRRDPGLVDLEQAQLEPSTGPPRALQQGGGDSARHVGAGAVVRGVDAGLSQHARDHAGGGRLSVGRAHDHGPALEATAKLLERPGGKSQQQLPRQAGASSAPADPGEAADGSGERELEAQHQDRTAGAITRMAPGTSLTLRGQPRDGLSIGIDVEGAVRGDLDLSRSEGPDTVELDVSSLEHLGQVSQEAQLRVLADQDHLQQAVVRLRLRRDPHAAAVEARVGRDHGVALEAVLARRRG